MKSRTRWLAVWFALAVTACSSAGPVTAPTFAASYGEALASEVKAGGQLRLSLPGIGPVLAPFGPDADPAATQLWDWYNPVLFSFTADGRAQRLDPDYLVDVRPDEASRPTVVRYRLNANARFNDGTPIDERSFEATWRAQAALGLGDGYAAIASVVREGEWVVVRLTRPFAGWRGLFQRIMHPQAALDAYRGTGLAAAHPEWGAGPYRLASLDASGARLVPNESWWGAPAKLDAVSLGVLGAGEALAAFEAGGLDAVDVTSGAASERAARVAGAEVRRGSSTGRLVVQLNHATSVLDDERTRRGVLTAVDRQGLAEVAFGGLGYAELPPSTALRFGFQAGDPGSAATLYATPGPDQAARWFDQVGWIKWSDGIRVRDGVQLRLRVVAFGDDDHARRMLATLVQQLRNSGIDAIADLRPRDELARVMSSDGWDVALRPVEGVPDGASELCRLYCSTGMLRASGGLDARLQLAADADALEREVLAQAWVLPVLEGPRLVAVRSGLANVGVTGFATPRASEVGWRSAP